LGSGEKETGGEKRGLNNGIREREGRDGRERR